MNISLALVCERAPPPLSCTRAQGSDRKRIPALQVLLAGVPLSHPGTSAASTDANPTSRSQDKEKSYLQ